MSHAVWKFVIDNHMKKIEMPKGAEILSAGSQAIGYAEQGYSHLACFWAKVDPDAEICTRTFALYTTGQTMLDSRHRFVGRITMGVLEFHLFEIV